MSEAGEVDTETLLRRVSDIISNTKSLPLTSTYKLDNKEEVLELLDEALERLPDELRQARWMLKERNEFLAKTQREADELLEAARVQAERMVQRTEIVRQAQHTAKRTIEDANDEARRLRHEFEIVLERTIKTVQAGRQKLQATPPSAPSGPAVPAATGDGGHDADAFFDQDQ